MNVRLGEYLPVEGTAGKGTVRLNDPQKHSGRVTNAGLAGFTGNRLCGEVPSMEPNKHPFAVGEDEY